MGKGIDPLTVGATVSQTGRWLGPEAIPDLVRPLYPEGYREGTFAALLVDYFRYHAAVGPRVPGEISELCRLPACARGR